MNRLEYRCAALTDPGRKRPNNQDFVTFFEPAEASQRAVFGNLYIVADGVGGEADGDRASRYAAEKVLYEYFQVHEMRGAERLAAVVRQSGNEIFEFYTQAGGARMATTLVAGLVLGDLLTIVNVGDSRAYLLRAGQTQQISRDHSLVDELLRAGQISEIESRESNIRNKITRSLGGEQDVEVDVFRDIPLQVGDRIVLCSDGLTRYLGPDRQLTDITDFWVDPETAVQAAVAFANQQGGGDNISVIVVEVSEGGQAAPRTETIAVPGQASGQDAPDTTEAGSRTAKTEPDLRALPKD